MSSEESDDDGLFTIHPLVGRREKVKKLFSCLDHKTDKRKSKKSKLMTQERTEGLPSDRPAPHDVPEWAVK